MSKYEATLKFGNVYAIGSKMFELNKPQVVTEDQKKYLEANAIIKHKASGRIFAECMFEFKEISATSRGVKKAPIPADDFSDEAPASEVAEDGEKTVVSEEEGKAPASRRRAAPKVEE